MSDPIIEIRGLRKTFGQGGAAVTALDGIDLTIEKGEIYGIIGLSGAGKSTLVRCMNLLETPTEGTVRVDGQEITTLSPKELRKARQSITMIFQGFNLLMQRNCLRNVCFPLELAGVKRSEAVKRATELLQLVGLGDKLKSYPAQLSGGQKQRVAVARALATRPKILLCDEATSALDPQTTQSILSLIRELHDKLGLTVIVITHQMSVVEQICTRVAILDHGEVVEEGPVSEVFASPKSDAAKALVYPDGYDAESVGDGDRVIRVVFNGAEATSMPIIARMAMEKNIAASILSASTRSLGGRMYGNMLLGIPGGAETLEEASAYLRAMPDLSVDEVKKSERC